VLEAGRPIPEGFVIHSSHKRQDIQFNLYLTSVTDFLLRSATVKIERIPIENYDRRPRVCGHFAPEAAVHLRFLAARVTQ